MDVIALAAAKQFSKKPSLQTYTEAVHTQEDVSGEVTIDMALANVHEWTVTGQVTQVTVTNVPSAGVASSLTLIVHRADPAHTINPPASAVFPDGIEPDMSTSNATHILTFVTVDGGSTWYGALVGEFPVS